METKANDYQLKQGEKVYIFSTSNVGNAIRLTCKNASGKVYSRDFSIAALNSIDPIFRVIKTETQAIDYIDKALSIHKVGVAEENGILKILFYVTTRGIIHTIEIPLGPSKLDNLSNVKGIALSAQAKESASQVYSTGGIKSYEQQQSSFIPPTITPVDEDANSGANFNVNEYMSQIQTSNGGVSYDTYQTQDFTGENKTNVENIGSFMLQDNKLYTQTNETTNLDFEGLKTSESAQINNEYTFNQYTTSADNNYKAEDYNTTYQESSTNYENITNQYNQSTQNFQEYQTTTQVKNIDTLPTITPVDDFESNQATVGTGEYQTYDTQVNNSSYINQEIPHYEASANDTQYDQQLYSTQNIPKTTTDNNYNNYFQQITTTETVQSTSQSVPPTEEINKQTNLTLTLSLPREKSPQAEEIASLKAKLSELEPLKQQVEEMNQLKYQLAELDMLRAKVAELSSTKSQLDELNMLKQQLNELRAKNNESEILKRKIEELEREKLENEQELKILRETKRVSETKEKVVNRGLESKQLTFEDKPEQICVKGDIIQDTDELEMITRKINKLNKKLTLNLLYKATADSDKASAFHEKCDEAKSTIVLIETDKGKRFGGFTTCSWRGDCIDKKDEDAFIFSLDKMKIYENIPGEEAIGCYPKFGPIFMGCQIRIYDNAFTRGGTTFEKGLNYKTEEDFELTEGERTFNVKEIEVYEVIPQ